MAKHKIKVLFFIADTLATDEENEAMEQFSVRHVVCVRNASMIGNNDTIEAFDIVAGAVPPQYAVAAEEKGPPIEREAPKTAVASAPAGSPLAPPVEPVAAPGPVVAPVEAPQPVAKAKAPAPKPNAASSWKPNA
jgi:hypothetical protein